MRDITAIVDSLADKPSVAKNVCSRISMILHEAVRYGHRDDNPATFAKPRKNGSGHRVKHREFMPHKEIGALLSELHADDGYPVYRLALEFTILTAARRNEVCGMKWSEVDFDRAVWAIPADRTKTKREQHRIPLSERAIEILNEARELPIQAKPYFPRETGWKSLSP